MGIETSLEFVEFNHCLPVQVLCTWVVEIQITELLSIDAFDTFFDGCRNKDFVALLLCQAQGLSSERRDFPSGRKLDRLWPMLSLVIWSSETGFWAWVD